MRLAWFLVSFMFGILAYSVYSAYDKPARFTLMLTGDSELPVLMQTYLTLLTTPVSEGLVITTKYVQSDQFIKEDLKMAAQYIGRFDKVLDYDATLMLTNAIKYLIYDADYHNICQEVLTVIVNAMRKTWEVTLLVLPELKGERAEYTVWSVMLGRVTTGLILGVIFVFIIDKALKDFKKPSTDYWRPLEFVPRKVNQSRRDRKRRLRTKS